MTISFPLSTTDFWDKLGVFEFDLDLVHYLKQSITGGGDILTAKFGEPKWAGNVVLRPNYHSESQNINALFKALLGRNGTFLAYDTRRDGPYEDADGSAISGSTVLVRDIGGDNRSLSLKGLPPGYVITVGDRFSVVNGTYRALFEAMETVVANGATNTVAFEVQPFLPPWIAVDQAVDLFRPVIKFRIVTGSYKTPKGRRNISDGASFSMISVSS